MTKLEEVDKKLEDEIANTVTPLAEKVALTASRVELETTKKYAASQSVYAAACDVWVHSDRLLVCSDTPPCSPLLTLSLALPPPRTLRPERTCMASGSSCRSPGRCYPLFPR